MYEEANNNNVEKGMRKKKEERTCRRESGQLNETSTYVNVPKSLKEKANENQSKLDLALAEIERLRNESTNLKKIV